MPEPSLFPEPRAPSFFLILVVCVYVLSRKARETIVSDYSTRSTVRGTLKVFEEAIKGKRTAGLR